MPRIQLVTRGDDAGSSRSANRAILQACAEGILRNVSLMAPGPAFDDAARLLAGRADLCFGLHVTLSSEWDFPNWGPVSARADVPSLVEPDGSFTRAPTVLHARGFQKEEALAEAAAQLARARAAGFRVAYLDEHMGVGWIGLRADLAAFARAEGLLDAAGIPSLPGGCPPDTDLAAGVIARLRRASDGVYAFVTHPMCDDEEARQFRAENLPPGQLARERDLDRRALLDPAFRMLAAGGEVRFARYDEVLSLDGFADGENTLTDER